MLIVQIILAVILDSRLVGQALKFLQAEGVPWQRVISSSGAISDRGDGGEGANRQAVRLRLGRYTNSALLVLRMLKSSPRFIMLAFWTFRRGRGL
jgi:alkylated DNA nucleotide flippase Atl1